MNVLFRRWPAVLVLALLLPTSCATRSGSRANYAMDIQPAVDAVYPALVRIHVVTEQGSDGRMSKGRASGSGVIISKDGYIVTNHHVAGRATRIVCRLSNREEVDAELVGTDALSDIAVLKLDLSSRRNPDAPLPFAQFGDSDALRVGDVVLAMGSPSGLSQSVTKGIVANTAMILPGGGGMELDGERVGELVRWIGHDAVIYRGNSGGPLVNLRGEIIGINEIGIATMGGAIPSNLARDVVQQLIAHGTVRRSWIGVEVQPLLKSDTAARGVLVATVLPESPALAAGIQPGDTITHVGDEALAESRSPEDIPVFNRLVLSLPVGAEVTLRGERAGQPMTWTLKTTNREPNMAREVELPGWGLTVRDFTRMAALENRRPDRRGALVDTVRAGGPSSDSKPPLRPEDVIRRVNQTDIADVAALQAFTRDFIRDLKEPKPVLVTFDRERQQLMTVVKVGPEVQVDKPGRPARAWLGAQTQVLTPDLAEALGLEGKKGVRVTMVISDSPADRAGLKVGDVLLKLDGRVISASTPSDQELFDNLIREYKVDAEVELAGVRAGEPLTLTAKLGRQPKPTSDLDEYKDELFEFKARDLSFGERVEQELPADLQGVRIVTVEGAGWAALAGLRSGDVLMTVNGQAVDSIAALKTQLAALRESKPRRVPVFIRRGIYTMFLELEPKW
jgi:serine protease Do